VNDGCERSSLTRSEGSINLWSTQGGVNRPRSPIQTRRGAHFAREVLGASESLERRRRARVDETHVVRRVVGAAGAPRRVHALEIGLGHDPAARGMELVPGIELSVEEGSYDVHLLGYFVTRPEVLREALDEIQRDRVTRALRMVERLAELGLPIDYANVQGRARGGVVGRPHVAEELVARGHASHINEAFDRFLGTDRPAYVAKRSVSLAEGVRLLREAGGVPVVAHPGASDLDELIPWLADLGVQGLEVWHPKHDERETRRYLNLAKRHNLVPTGGSDFHREAPGATLPGDLRLALDVVDALRPHAT